MREKYQSEKNILAIDCCKHVLSTFEILTDCSVTVFDSINNMNAAFPGCDPDLIVIGVLNIPMRRIFSGRMRRFYPDVPMLILRREITKSVKLRREIKGDFILSANRHRDDLGLVKCVSAVLPLKYCFHPKLEDNYDLVTNVTRIIREHFSDPQLNLNQVAEEIPAAPSKLSRILNKHAGVSFRQLLRHIRIEEAKRMLSSHRYSVKEVAARVGFADSHYFSRSFKEITGLNATKYEYSSHDLLSNSNK